MMIMLDLQANCPVMVQYCYFFGSFAVSAIMRRNHSHRESGANWMLSSQYLKYYLRFAD